METTFAQLHGRIMGNFDSCVAVGGWMALLVPNRKLEYSPIHMTLFKITVHCFPADAVRIVQILDEHRCSLVVSPLQKTISIEGDRMTDAMDEGEMKFLDSAGNIAAEMYKGRTYAPSKIRAEDFSANSTKTFLLNIEFSRLSKRSFELASSAVLTLLNENWTKPQNIDFMFEKPSRDPALFREVIPAGELLQRLSGRNSQHKIPELIRSEDVVLFRSRLSNSVWISCDAARASDVYALWLEHVGAMPGIRRLGNDIALDSDPPKVTAISDAIRIQKGAVLDDAKSARDAMIDAEARIEYLTSTLASEQPYNAFLKRQATSDKEAVDANMYKSTLVPSAAQYAPALAAIAANSFELWLRFDLNVKKHQVDLKATKESLASATLAREGFAQELSQIANRATGIRTARVRAIKQLADDLTAAEAAAVGSTADTSRIMFARKCKDMSGRVTMHFIPGKHVVPPPEFYAALFDGRQVSLRWQIPFYNKEVVLAIVPT
jgi:hypothetical protein